jgi:hypothetical protein
MRDLHLPFSPVAAALLAAVLPAQFVTVPAKADAVDSHQSVGQPFGTPGFRTQILIDAAAIAPNGAALTGMRFRADRSSVPLTAGSVPNVTVQLSHTSVLVGGLVDTFANNVTSTATTVFQGTVTLPAQTNGLAGPLPFDIVIPFAQPFPYTTGLGNLLVEITGNNAPGGFPSYWLDASQAGGSATRFGKNGDNPTFDSLNLIVATGNTLEARFLIPGHVIEYTSTLSFTQPPGVLALGTTAFSSPIDLGPFGAPTNELHFDPILLVTHSWQQSFIGWFSTFSVTPPGLTSLIGATIYGQSLILEASANPLGIVLSHAVETCLGDPNEAFPMQQVDANGPTALTGTIVDFGFALQHEYGAVPVRLEGAFF